MNKELEIFKWSNPAEVLKKAEKYLGKGVVLAISTRKDKKYMVQKPDGKWVHFGQMGYEDYTKHKNKQQRMNYLNRATNIRGKWKDEKYSPNNLSINILW